MNSASPNTLVFTDANFNDEVLAAHVTVLVDFWTEGCGGCRQLAPAIDLLADEYVGKATAKPPCAIASELFRRYW